MQTITEKSIAKFVDSDFLLEWGKFGNGLEIKTLSIKRVVLSTTKEFITFKQDIHSVNIFIQSK